MVVALLGLTALAWWWRPHRIPVEDTGRLPKMETPVRTNAAVTLIRSKPAAPLPEEKPPVKPARENTSALSSPKPVIAASTNGPIPFVAHPVQDIFEAQVALVRRGISSGSIDGVAGSQTKAALAAFQKMEALPVTGALDPETQARLILSTPVLSNYFVAAEDLSRLQPLGQTWLEKSEQTRLDYESLLELVAERFYCHPSLIRRLNPSLVWSNVSVDSSVTVPNVDVPVPKSKAAWVRIELGRKNLQAFDANSNLLVHFPCSIAARVDKRPVGELHVAVLAPNPNYVFDPDNFPESLEARELNRKLVLPPGPNNPVGTSWIGLDKAGYGIHGTPRPEEVGRTESHGCFRLANWNADHLLRLVVLGTPVIVEP